MSNHGRTTSHAATGEAQPQLTRVLLTFLLLLSPACGSVGIRQNRQLIIKPPTPSVPTASAKENRTLAALSALNNVTASLLDARNITRQTSAGAANKIINPATTSQIFLNYGLALTAAIYGLIGIGYFYGPYSVDAFLAKQRSEHRLEYLRQRLEGDGHADEEVDYGDYVEEELWAFREPYHQQATGYSAPAQQYGSETNYNPGHGHQYLPEERVQQAAPLDEHAESSHSQHQQVAIGQVSRRQGVAYPVKEHVQGTFSPSMKMQEHHIRNSMDAADTHFNQKIEQLRSMLDMDHKDCREWIRCLLQRNRHQLMSRNTKSDWTKNACWQHQKTCPIKNSQSLNTPARHWSTQQRISYHPSDDVKNSNIDSQNVNAPTPHH